MAETDSKNTDDFFAMLAQDDEKKQPAQAVLDPFTGEEIIFRDDTGQFKTLKGSQVTEVPETNQAITSTRVNMPAVTQPVKPVVGGKSLDINQEVALVVKKANLELTDPQIKKRFEEVVRSRLKGIRDQVQTREILLSSIMVGGLGLAEQKVDQILQIINQESQALDDRLRLKVGGEPFADLKAEATKILREPESVEPPTLVFDYERKFGSQTSQPVPLASSQAAAKPLSSQPVARQDSSQTATLKPNQKPKIEDVRFRPRLIGPIEEIKSITLADFRRLGADPVSAAESVMEKIKTIERDSFSDYLEAIRAWKDSEVNQLYLDIGHQSMAQHVSVDQIIKSRQASSQPTLTQEEFDAISDFNQQLRH